MVKTLKGIITAIIAVALLLIAMLPVALLALLKLILPGAQAKRFVARLLSSFAEHWLMCGRWCYCLLHQPDWLRGLPESLSREKSYLVLANHKSWSDIPVLMFLLIGHVPFFRFLMKRVLVWLPVVGWGAWALDFPLLHRFSKAHLLAHPEDRQKDQDSLAELCASLQQQPATIIIFAEGTRFTEAKHAAQNSPYQHLLQPRSGGVSILLQGLGEQINQCLDFTLIYRGDAGFWRFLTGELELRVELTTRDIPDTFTKNSAANELGHSARVKDWLSDMWAEKDQLLS